MVNCSQTNRILRYLKRGHSLTSLGALRKFGCLRLGARVYELRQREVPIDSVMVKRGGKYVALYSMRKAWQ